MPKNKLEISRLNIINYVNNIWNSINPINKNIIINGFEKARFIGKSYFSLEEEKILEGALFDLNIKNNKFEILDDLGNNANINNDSSGNDNSISSEMANDVIGQEETSNKYKEELNDIENNLNLDDLNKMDIDSI